MTYDAAGNIINDGVHSYTYDAEYRITQVDGGGTASYAYDALGRRIQRTTGGNFYNDFYDLNGNMVVEVRNNNTWVRGELYAGGRHLGTYAGTTTFSHTDWLGTERVRTDSTGAIWNSCTSNAYGDNQNCSGSSDPSPIHYAGMEYDSETQLYHTLFRYYNPRLGLWMTPDPAGMGAANGGDPQSLSRYAYVVNNPCNLVDGLGLTSYSCTLTYSSDAGLPLDLQKAIETIFNNAGVGVKFVSGPADMQVRTYQHLSGDALGRLDDPTFVSNTVSLDNYKFNAMIGGKFGQWNIQNAMGVVLAHEFGHFLLKCAHGGAGAIDCGGVGLMRPGTDQGENPFYLDVGGSSRFTSAQAAAIRKRCKDLHKKNQPSNNGGAGGSGFIGDGGGADYWQAIYWFSSKGGWEWGVDYTLFFGGWVWVPGSSNRPKL